MISTHPLQQDNRFFVLQLIADENAEIKMIMAVLLKKHIGY